MKIFARRLWNGMACMWCLQVVSWCQWSIIMMCECGLRPCDRVLSCTIHVTVFPLIEAGSLTEAGRSEGKYHRTNCTSPRGTVVHCVIRAVVRIAWLAERRYGLAGILLCSNKYETKNLGVWNNVMFIGEPGGSNRSRVFNTSRVSNRSRGSDTIVLIEAGGFY